MPLLLIIIAVFAGITVYSSQAKPGDSFYPVELLIEQGHSSVIFDEAERAKFKIDLTKTRVKEALALVSANKDTDLDKVVLNLQADAKGAVDTIKQFKKHGVQNSALFKIVDQGLLDARQSLGDLRLKTRLSEIQDEMNFPRVLDKRAFYFLRKSVASWPLKKVSAEWDDLVSIISSSQELGPCTCGMIERLGLPCRHTLECFFHDEIPIPLTFIHPRWWYDGPIESRANWRPHCGNVSSTKDGEEKLPRDRPVHGITQSTNDLLAFKETLDSEQQEKLAAAHLSATKQLLEDAQRQQAFKSSLPQLLPPPIPSTFNRKAKSHDKATKRSMLGVEIAIQDADRSEKEARTKGAAQVVDDGDTTFAPRTPSRKRTTTLVDRTPEKPREAPSTRLGIPSAPILVTSAAVIVASVSTEPAHSATTVTQSRSGRQVKKRDYRSVNSEGI